VTLITKLKAENRPKKTNESVFRHILNYKSENIHDAIQNDIWFVPLNLFQALKVDSYPAIQ
jgi:hypothetical protein